MASVDEKGVAGLPELEAGVLEITDEEVVEVLVDVVVGCVLVVVVDVVGAGAWLVVVGAAHDTATPFAAQRELR